MLCFVMFSTESGRYCNTGDLMFCFVIFSSESGRYCCTGENSEGETSSNIITVDVKCKPMMLNAKCRTNIKLLFGKISFYSLYIFNISQV